MNDGGDNDNDNDGDGRLYWLSVNCVGASGGVEIRDGFGSEDGTPFGNLREQHPLCKRRCCVLRPEEMMMVEEGML